MSNNYSIKFAQLNRNVEGMFQGKMPGVGRGITTSSQVLHNNLNKASPQKVIPGLSDNYCAFSAETMQDLGLPNYHVDDEYKEENSPDTCEFCNRKAKNIVCRGCGYIFTGRVRSNCTKHPGIIHLMDITCCPNCRSSQLKEFGTS